MDFKKVDQSNVNILYELNLRLAADEGQKDLFTANRSSYSEAFLGKGPISFGFISYLSEQPIGFYIYFFKFASYLGSRVLYIEDIYLLEECRTSENKTALLRHAVQQSKAENCCRIETRVLKSFNIGYDILSEFGFNKIQKWDVFRFEL